jgi:hypothetical protein
VTTATLRRRRIFLCARRDAGEWFDTSQRKRVSSVRSHPVTDVIGGCLSLKLLQILKENVVQCGSLV